MLTAIPPSSIDLLCRAGEVHSHNVARSAEQIAIGARVAHVPITQLLFRFLADSPATADREGYTYRVALENYVGRVGGLAVALGIGAAVATGWSCPAWADSTDGSVNAPASDTQKSNTSDTAPKPAADPDAGKDSGSVSDPAGSSGVETDSSTGDLKDDPDVPDAADPPSAAEPTGQATEHHSDGSRKVAATDSDTGEKADVGTDTDADPQPADVDEQVDVVEPPAPAAPTKVESSALAAVELAPVAAEPEQEPATPEVVAAAVSELAPSDEGSNSDPISPLQTTAALTVLAAVTTETQRKSLVDSASYVAPQVTSSEPDTTPNVLLIGVDGTNLSKILANAANSNFFGLMQTGTTAASSIVGHTTISNPSWTTILTGVWGETSGVINNIYNPAVYDAWPTVFNQLEGLNSSIHTTAIADWDVIAAIAASGSLPADSVQYVSQIAGDTDWSLTDDAVGAATVNAINSADYSVGNFMFSYFVGVDENGHMHGGGSQQYADAITNVDENLAAIMAAIAASGEQWTIIVVTDHGHQQSQGFGHGFQSPNETSTFVIANNPNLFTPGNINLQYSIVDTTPTVVTLFGGTPASYSQGVSLTTLGDADVTPINDEDGLRGALQDIIDMNGYPNIGVDIALGARTLFASVPYFVVQITDSITSALQAIADQDIFLISPLASLAILPIQLLGDALYIPTNILAQIVAALTGVSNTSIFPLLPAPLPPLEGPPSGLQDSAAATCDEPGAGADYCVVA